MDEAGEPEPLRMEDSPLAEVRDLRRPWEEDMAGEAAFMDGDLKLSGGADGEKGVPAKSPSSLALY